MTENEKLIDVILQSRILVVEDTIVVASFVDHNGWTHRLEGKAIDVARQVEKLSGSRSLPAPGSAGSSSVEVPQFDKRRVFLEVDDVLVMDPERWDKLEIFTSIYRPRNRGDEKDRLAVLKFGGHSYRAREVR